MKKLYGLTAYVQSAGVKNDMEVDGFSVAVCAEMGIELSRHRSRSFDEMKEWGDDLTGFDCAREDKARSRRTDVEPAVARAHFGKLRLGEADARSGRVARGEELIDAGLRDEAAADELLRSIEIILRYAGIGARDVERGFLLRDLLRLDRALDRGEHLPGADPLAGLDEHARDHAAFADDRDRHVDPRGERSGAKDLTIDRLAAGDEYGHGRRLIA